MTSHPPAALLALASVLSLAPVRADPGAGPGGAAGGGAGSDAGARWLQPYVEAARASGWEPIGVDPATPTRYVDLARPADVGRRGEYLETSIREERSAPANLDLDGSPFSYLSTSGRWVVDCRGNRFTAVSQSWYRGNGLTGESHAESDPSLEHWNPILPDSLGAIVRNWVCARASRP